MNDVHIKEKPINFTQKKKKLIDNTNLSVRGCKEAATFWRSNEIVNIMHYFCSRFSLAIFEDRVLCFDCLAGEHTEMAFFTSRIFMNGNDIDRVFDVESNA